MIDDKRNEESQEPCSQNTDQVSTAPVNVRLEIYLKSRRSFFSVSASLYASRYEQEIQTTWLIVSANLLRSQLLLSISSIEYQLGEFQDRCTRGTKSRKRFVRKILYTRKVNSSTSNFNTLKVGTLKWNNRFSATRFSFERKKKTKRRQRFY